MSGRPYSATRLELLLELVRNADVPTSEAASQEILYRFEEHHGECQTLYECKDCGSVSMFPGTCKTCESKLKPVLYYRASRKQQRLTITHSYCSKHGIWWLKGTFCPECAKISVQNVDKKSYGGV